MLKTRGVIVCHEAFWNASIERERSEVASFMIGLKNQPSHADQVIAQEISGTLVLLSIQNGQYYSLNELGGRVWALCDGARTVAEILDLLRGEYDVPDDCVRVSSPPA